MTMTDDFPGPTIEARSGDIVEIEVFNFADEEISLHWHGLHMRGAYPAILWLANTGLTLKINRSKSNGRTSWYHTVCNQARGEFYVSSLNR
jgi:FtsP/CotA-like multicopper oxidase with cupredoxin domain